MPLGQPLDQIMNAPLPPVPGMAGQDKSQQIGSIVGYKTQICKHYQMSNGNCVKGFNCHFAHGESELRKRDDVSKLFHLFLTINVDYYSHFLMS